MRDAQTAKPQTFRTGDGWFACQPGPGPGWQPAPPNIPPRRTGKPLCTTERDGSATRVLRTPGPSSDQIPAAPVQQPDPGTGLAAAQHHVPTAEHPHLGQKTEQTAPGRERTRRNLNLRPSTPEKPGNQGDLIPTGSPLPDQPPLRSPPARWQQVRLLQPDRQTPETGAGPRHPKVGRGTGTVRQPGRSLPHLQPETEEPAPRNSDGNPDSPQVVVFLATIVDVTVGS